MNGFLWAALVFAILGIAALVVGALWGRKETSADDFVAALAALIVLIICETMAVVLAIIGCIVKIF
jgi:hypothetical protein